MTAQIRLLLLVLVLAYSVAFGIETALAASSSRAQEHRLRVARPRPRRYIQSESAASALGVRAVRFARRLIGVPYRWGGDSPATGFDCSGFVRFVYQHLGIALPHSSYADFGLGTPVPRASLRPGDLVFFDGVGHVGMYIGNGRFIHAPHTGTDVQVTSMSDPYFESRYDGARRLGVALVQRVARRVVPATGLNVLGVRLDNTWYRASYGRVRAALSGATTGPARRAGSRSPRS
jgi:hypothetical protein